MSGRLHGGLRRGVSSILGATRAAALTLAAATLCACSTGRPGDYTPHAAAQTYPPWASDGYQYRIGAGDELALRFVVTPDLNAPVTVGPDGSAIFPFISSLPVAGLTAPELNTILTRRYAAVLRNPEVQVLVTGYGASQIYVAGEVKTPGVFNIRSQLTVAQAVATAGGLLDTARTGRIVLLRQRPGEAQPLMRVIDLNQLYRQGVDNDPGPVLPGDLIFVPRSRIAEVDRIVDQYVNKSLPFTRSVGYDLGNVRN